MLKVLAVMYQGENADVIIGGNDIGGGAGNRDFCFPLFDLRFV